MQRKALAYRFDDFSVSPRAFRVTRAGEPVHFEPKAFEVLVYLIEHRDRVVEKSELLDAVWREAFVTENALTRVIAQLRKGLGDSREGRIIETAHRRGYRFVAAVEVEQGADGPAAAPPVTPAALDATSFAASSPDA